RRKYKMLIGIQNEFIDLSEKSVYNKLIKGKDNSLGILCCGITYNYLMEHYPENDCPYTLLKIGQYPLPKKLIKELENECEEILVIEDGYPLVEDQLTDYFGKGKKIKGRLDGTLPRDGELNPDLVAIALGLDCQTEASPSSNIVQRPPALCAGCG